MNLIRFSIYDVVHMVQVHACGAHVVHCNGMRIHSLFSVS